MPHLNETQMLDALDGRLEPNAADHVAACDVCRLRVEELRSVLQRVEAAQDLPEPSPLFWEHFPARVSRAIDAGPEPVSWFIAWRWWGSAATAAVVILMLLLPLRREAAAPAPVPQAENASVVPSSESAASEPVTITPENLDDDEAWAMVRAVAEETDYDEVQESGLSPRPGSVERAAIELSEDERAELVRLIEQDARLTRQQLKRTGASIP